MRFWVYILCLVFSFLVVPCSWAAWTESITVTDMEGNLRVVTFGEHPDALAGFDPMDTPTPPLPPAGQYLDAVFVVTGLFSRLTTDIKQEGVNNQWELEVRCDTGDIKLAWDIDNIPPDRSISLIGNTDIDMRTTNSLVLPSGRHTLILEVAMQQISYMADPVPTSSPVPGDMNNDGVVGQADTMLVYRVLIGMWLANGGDAQGNPNDARSLLISILGLAPGRSRSDENSVISLDKAQNTSEDGVSDSSPLVWPGGKHTTTWAAIKAY